MRLIKFSEETSFKIIIIIIILGLLRFTQCFVYKYILKKDLPYYLDCPLEKNGVKNSIIMIQCSIIIVILLSK